MAVSKAVLEDYSGFNLGATNSTVFSGTKSSIISGLISTSAGSAAQSLDESSGPIVEILDPVFSSTLDPVIPVGNRIRRLGLEARIAGEFADSSNPSLFRQLMFKQVGSALTWSISEGGIAANTYTLHTIGGTPHSGPTPATEITEWSGITLSLINWFIHTSSGSGPRKIKSYDLRFRVIHYSPPVASNLTGERTLDGVKLAWDFDPDEVATAFAVNRSGFREVYIFALEDAPDPDNMPSLSLLVASGTSSILGPDNATDTITIDDANIRNFRDYRVYARSARGDWPYDPPFYSNWTSAVVNFEPNGVVRPVVISVSPISDRKYNRTEVNLDSGHTGSDYDPEYYYVLRDGKRVTGNIPIGDKYFHDVAITPGFEHSYSAIASALSALDGDTYVDSAESDFVLADPVVYDRWLLRNANHQELASSNTDPLSDYDEFNMILEVDGDSSLDMESGDDRADFNPLGRRGYISISDTLRGYKFSVDIQLMGYEEYQRFQKMRESRALMLLQAPMTGRKWYFRLGKVREKIQNTASDYYKATFDVAENDEPSILGLTDTFMDNPHGS